jgi:subtilisin family serine protease
MDPRLVELFESGPADDEVGVIIRMAKGMEPPPIARVVSEFDDVFTARVQRADIVTLRESPGVFSVKASTAVYLPGAPGKGLETATEDDGGEIDDSDDSAGSFPVERVALPSIPEDGTGVVVGICDWGFDFTHPNLQKPDGTTRLLCLWDQRGFGHPLAPAPYNYGRLLTREAINAALATPDPCATLGYHASSADPTDTGSHGTHVADILAGSRREPGSEVGLASGADIVFVHLAAPRLGELGNLGDSCGLLEGLDFCRKQAAGRPCVLHLSAGKTGGEKRGLSPLERAVDTMLKKPGVVLVQSVGNYANSAMHTHARIGPDQHHVLNWVIAPRDPTHNELEIWYSGEDVFDVTLIAPNGREFSLALDGRMRLDHEGTRWGSFYHRRHEPNSGLNHIAIYLYSGAPGGMWRVALRGRDVVDGRIQAWIERDARRRYQSHFLRSQASSQFTTNTICNCFRAIAVGAYDATRRDRPATLFSSRGPTADGRQKPEIVAPGFMVRAARSRPRDGWRGGESRLCVKSGTSMAAPWVSGTVALMMQAAGRPLTVYEIRRALIGSADPHPGPAGRSSTKLGYGYLNTAAAVAAARRIGRSKPPAVTTESSETLAEDCGWTPVWVEDAAAGIGMAPAIEMTAPADLEFVESIEASEPCGCMGRKGSSAAEREPFEAWAAGESEEELFEQSGPESGSIEAPFGWDDVRDALEAVGERGDRG